MGESILIEDRKKIIIKGAVKVKTCTQNFAVVETQECVATISGSEIEVVKLDLENKEVVFSGNISSIKFSSQKEKSSFFKRIFK